MKLPLLLTFLFVLNFTEAQISFTAPDTICANEIFSIQNTSNSNQDFYWSFCGRDVTNLPELSSFEIDFLGKPVFMDIQKEGDNYFGFVTDVEGKLARLDFGTSLSNTPTTVDLSNIGNLFFGMEGIQLIQEDNQWFGFIVGGTGNERMLRLDFGSSLENTPTVTDFGNIAEFNFPNDLRIEKNGNDWYGVTLNRWFGGSISVLSFDDGLANPPSGFSVGNIGNLSAPTGFSLIQQNIDYALFIANEGNGTISRIDFGGIFGGFPTGTNLGDLGILNAPRDILVFEQCGDYFGYVLDTLSGRLIELEFGDDITNTPNASILLENEDWIFPHSFSSFFRENNTLYLFVLDAGKNVITRLDFPECLDASVVAHEGFQPPLIFYKKEGTYQIQLLANEGTPYQKSFCKDIVILPTPDLDLGMDTSLCIGDEFLLTTENAETIWQGQTVDESFEIFETGFYTAQIDGAECSSYDTIFVEFKDCKNCLVFPNAFTPDEDGINDFFQPVLDCPVNFESYELQIFNRWGQQVFQTTNPQNGWNGKKDGKDATSDVYVWITYFSFLENGKKFEKTETGDVSLIR